MIHENWNTDMLHRTVRIRPSGAGGLADCHGNPGRVPKPSRDGARRAKLGGSPRVCLARATFNLVRLVNYAGYAVYRFTSTARHMYQLATDANGAQARAVRSIVLALGRLRMP